MPTGNGLPKDPRGTSANIKITTRDQVKGDSAIDSVIRQLQRRCNELESSLTLASNAPTVTPDLQKHLDLHWALLRQAHDELDSTSGAAALAEAELAQFHTLYEEYEMNLLRENDSPMSLNLALPSISNPEFNGEYLDWPRFHDLSVEFVHNKPYLASQKLHILQSSLRGDARNVLTDTTFSQGGYGDTWLRLKARYQNGKILVFAAIAKIIDHKPIDGSSCQLRALHDTIKKSMSTLKNLDISKKSWDPILCFLIRRKLEQQSLAALENLADAPTEIPTLWSVLTFIERLACMLEAISAQPTATLRHQSVHNEESCKICNLGQHCLRACSRIQQMDPKARRQAIIQVGAYTNCLSTAHKVENCGSPSTCRVCQQRHHSLLHQGPTSNPVAGAVTIAGYDDLGGCTLLATAKVSLQGPNGQFQTCRAVIDGGSQVNLISRSHRLNIWNRRKNINSN